MGDLEQYEDPIRIFRSRSSARERISRVNVNFQRCIVCMFLFQRWTVSE